MALDLTDYSANTNTLTNTGAADVTTNLPFAESTHAADFESLSSNKMEATDHASLDITTTISIEFWIKLESAIGFAGVMEKGYDTSAVDRPVNYFIDLGSDGLSPRFLYVDGSNNFHVHELTGTNLVTGTWAHVGVTYTYGTGASLQWYLNGSTTGATGSWTVGDGNSAGLSNVSTFRLGYRSTSGADAGFLDGQLDEIRIWNDIRTGTEITNNYNHVIQAPASEANLAAYWPFEAAVSPSASRSPSASSSASRSPSASTSPSGSRSPSASRSPSSSISASTSPSSSASASRSPSASLSPSSSRSPSSSLSASLSPSASVSPSSSSSRSLSPSASISPSSSSSASRSPSASLSPSSSTSASLSPSASVSPSSSSSRSLSPSSSVSPSSSSSASRSPSMSLSASTSPSSSLSPSSSVSPSLSPSSSLSSSPSASISPSSSLSSSPSASESVSMSPSASASSSPSPAISGKHDDIIAIEQEDSLVIKQTAPTEITATQKEDNLTILPNVGDGDITITP